jgi:hypothetical protein
VNSTDIYVGLRIVRAIHELPYQKSRRDERIIELKNEKFIQKNPEGMTGL